MAFGLAGAVILAMLPGGAVFASERVEMRGEAGSGATEIVVDTTAGRFDRMADAALRMTLNLSAVPLPGNKSFKILASELYLKQAGAASGTVKAQGGGSKLPAGALRIAETFQFPLERAGAIEQNAVALCGAAGRTRTEPSVMTVPVVWRVRTGRFNFKWTDYDRVALTDDIVANEAFYSDLEVTEIEIPVGVTVACDTGKLATKDADDNTLRSSYKPVSEAVHVGERETATLAPIPVVATNVPQKSAILPPVCEGGMVRAVGETSGSFACLCPGNTHRVSKGTDIFACVKHTARR